MSKELNDRWDRLIELGKARWLRGMRGHDRRRYFTVIADDSDEYFWVRFDVVDRQGRREHCFSRRPRENPPIVPDLTDPATLGCLLGQARKAWSSSDMTLKRGWCFTAKAWVWSVRTEPRPLEALGEQPGHPSEWRTMSCGGGETEAEALVAALEAAP